MTIADAFNEITIAQGGTPNYSGTIASAIDALNDTLAGSDQDAAQTIEGAVRLLGAHIGGGGGGGTEYTITCLNDGEPVSSYVYKAVWDAGTNGYEKDPDSPALDKAAAGDLIYIESPENKVSNVADANDYLIADALIAAGIYMPSSAITVYAYVD